MKTRLAAIGAALALGTLSASAAETLVSPCVQETKVICREPGRSLCWPTLCRRASGELLVVFSGDRDQHVCPWGKVQMIRSTDEGKTWSKPETIQNGILDDRDAGIVELKDGTLLVNWFTSVAFSWPLDNNWLRPEDRSAEAGYGRHYLTLPRDLVRATLGAWTARSTDGGKTWEKSVRTTGQLPHAFTALKDGRVLAITRYSDGTGKSRFDKGEALEGEPGYKAIGRHIICEESRDGGKSWRVLAELQPADGVKVMDLHEPHLVEMPDGRLVTQIRWHGKQPKSLSGGNGIVQAESSDGGKTWTKMTEQPMLGNPPHLLVLKDGRLLSVYAKRFHGAEGEYACLSSDGGRTWDMEHEVCLSRFTNWDIGYPSSAQLSDGTILTVYYQPLKEGESPVIQATRWTLPPLSR